MVKSFFAWDLLQKKIYVPKNILTNGEIILMFKANAKKELPNGSETNLNNLFNSANITKILKA
jgi:hypothetical protein